MTTTINASTSSGLVNTADTSGVLQLQTASTAALTIDASQNVGIGTASPAQKFHISAASGSVYQQISSGANNIYFGYVSADAAASIQSNGAITFLSGGSYTERMRITSAGLVGIGTTTDLSSLTTLGAASTVSNGASTRAPVASMRGGNNNNRFDVYVDNSGATSIMGLGAYNTAGAPTAMTFYTGTTVAERMRIDASGYIGIGETNNTESMVQIKATSSQKPQLQLVQDNATDGWNLNATSAGGQLNFQRKGSGGTNTVVYYSTSGDLIISGSTGQKASGTTWSNPSDARLKDNVQDYTKGLAELAQVNVKTWDYNGKAGTTEGSKGLGVIADEIMKVLPETVDTYKAKLNADDEVETDVKRFDATEITWLLVNAVKELNAKVTALEAQLGAK